MQNLNKLFFFFIVACFLIICPSAEAKKKKVDLPQLRDSEELTFEFNKETLEYRFKTSHDGNNMRFIKVFCEKNFQINCKAISSDKSSKLRIKYNKSFDVKLGNIALLADIPQDKSEYQWEIKVRKNQLPNSIKVTMVKSFPIEVATFSKEISGIMIKNVPMTDVQINPESDTNAYPETPYYHYSNNRTADMTPEGDAIIWVAPGIWRLSVKSQNKKDSGELSARLIPTLPGKLTIVNWPSNLSKFISPPKAVKNAKININLAKIEKEIGQIDFTVLESSLVTPNKKNTEVTQGSEKVDIISIKRLETPINTVLLLDSSGSMKRDMKQVVKEAVNFVKNFDDKANISVVDFDTKPKPIKAKSRKILIDKLKKVKPNGATALYDSVLLGLKQLKGKQRASLILFTDGKDANYNDTKQGSKASAKQMFDAVKNSNIPVFTIGYGKSPDNSTLNRISELSGGTYYKANDKNLDEVFEKIKKNLGNSFELTYKLPKVQIAGDDPILLVMLDKSGSMNADASRCDGCGHRIEKVRQALIDFISKAPKNVILEFGTFNTSSKIDQVATKDKAKIIRAISNIKAGGGTDSLRAMKDSYNALSIPSTKKYLIFITDAALEAPKSQDEFDLTLNKIKDSGIKSIWVGIGVNDKYKKLFDHAAELSGGKSLMAKKSTDLTNMFSEILEDLSKSKQNATKIPVGISVKHKTTEGLPAIFSASKMIDKPKDIVQEGEPVSLDILSYDYKNLKTPYANSSGSKIIWGNDIALKEVRINRKIPLNIEAKTKAVKMTINNIYLLSRLRGFKQNRKLMVAMDIDMTNVLEKQKVITYPNGSAHPANWVGKADTSGVEKMMIPPYLIPNLTNHLFMRWNNSAERPISNATWLTEKPFILPGDNSIYLNPGETISGAVVFMVPQNEMKNVSLHYYDNSYGNVDIPVIGKMALRSTDEQKETTSEFKSLSDTFSMKVQSYSDTNSLSGIELKENDLFRTVSVGIKSKVEALLKLNPSERIYMRISTPLGWLIQSVHPVTMNVPFGFYTPAVLSPGSYNKHNLVFIIPEILKNNHADIVVSLRGKDVILPINGAAECKPELGEATASADGIDIVVNSVKHLQRLDGYNRRLIAVDITFIDKEDNTETRLRNPLLLSAKDKIEKDFENNAKKRGLGSFSSNTGGVSRYNVSKYNDTRIFGIDKKQIIKDGYAQRMIALFESVKDEKDLYLLSPIFKNLKYKINYDEIKKNKLTQKESCLLSKKIEVETKNDRAYEQEVLKKLKTISAERLANGFVKPGAKTIVKISLDGKKEIEKEICNVPAITIYGIEKFSKLDSIEAVKKELGKLQFISNGSTSTLYSPAAIISQGFANAKDFLKLMISVLQKKPVDIVTYQIILSDEGKQKLKDTYKLTKSPDRIYAVKVGTGKDARKLVVPMLNYVDEIPEYIRKIRTIGYKSLITTSKVTMKVSIVAKRTSSGANMQMGGMAGALGGSSKSSEKEFDLCEWRATNDFLSNQAIDIAFAKSLDGSVRAVVYGTETGTIVSENPLPKEYKAKKIKIYIYNNTVGYASPYEYELPEESQVSDNFFTLGINTPSLTKDAIDTLNKRREEKKKSVKNPASLSILQWHTRTILSKFIANQSMYEAKIAKELDIVQGRSDTSRVIIVGVAKNSKKGILQTRLDLKYVKNVPQSENKEAIKAFNIMTGLLNTVSEANALGENGISVASLWSIANVDNVIPITSKNSRDLLELMKGKGFPRYLINRLKKLRNNVCLLLPSKPAIIDGKPYWGWFEIRKDDYSVQSIMQNSEHGALVETTIMEALSNSGLAVVGFFKGVETSVWSVSAMSFNETNHKLLLAKAKKLAMGLKDRFGSVGKSFGDIINDALTLKKSSGTPAGGVKISLVDLIKDKKLLQRDVGAPDFSAGFEAGINYYFEHAK